MTGTCANSSCTANATKRCAGCKQASYCCSSCQRQDWPHHKSACKKRARAPNAEASPYHCSNLGCLARPDQVNMPCTRCNGATFCSTLCQKEAWEDHKHNCRPASIANDTDAMAVMIHSQTSGGGRYSALLVPRSDPIFETAPTTNKSCSRSSRCNPSFASYLLLRRLRVENSGVLNSASVLLPRSRFCRHVLRAPCLRQSRNHSSCH